MDFDDEIDDLLELEGKITGLAGPLSAIPQVTESAPLNLPICGAGQAAKRPAEDGWKGSGELCRQNLCQTYAARHSWTGCPAGRKRARCNEWDDDDLEPPDDLPDSAWQAPAGWQQASGPERSQGGPGSGPGTRQEWAAPTAQAVLRQPKQHHAASGRRPAAQVLAAAHPCSCTSPSQGAVLSSGPNLTTHYLQVGSMPAVAAPLRSPAKSSAHPASPAGSLAEAVPSGPDVEMQAETSPGRGLPAACSPSSPEKEFTVTLEDGRRAYCTLKVSSASPFSSIV